MHEAAHFRRRDHWVRIIALTATGFFWWHPVVWWARREIEAVEEECCDALVVKSMTAPPKRYAEAILETVDFLTELQLKLPPLATGLGQVPFLRQRLTWIMRGPRRQDLGYCGRLLGLMLACSLPVQPTWLTANVSAPVQPNIPSQSIESTPRPIPLSVPVLNSNIVASVTGDVTLPSATGQLETHPTGQSRKRYQVKTHSSDGRFAVLGNEESQLLLDLETGTEFDLNDIGIQSMAFAPNTHRFVTVGKDHLLRLWNAETREVEVAWNVPGGSTKSVDVSPNARWIATGGRDGIVRIWHVSSSQLVRELSPELAPVNCVRFSPNGESLAVATGDWMTPQTGRIALIDVSGWTERISMNWNSPAAAVAFRSDGQTMMSGDWEGRVARWSITSGELLGISEGHKDLMAAAEFSPNGSPLAEIEVNDLPADGSWEKLSQPIPFVGFSVVGR